jgi:hypothetical protein
MGNFLSNNCATIKMAEAPDKSQCKCVTNSNSSLTLCIYCQPSSSNSSTIQSLESSSSAGLPVPSEGVSKRTFKNLSLGCRKQPKSKDKLERTSKSKLNWTLRWRKSPQVSETREPMIDLNRFNPSEYPIEDKDEAARRARAREIAEGIEMEIESLPRNYRQSDAGSLAPPNEASSLLSKSTLENCEASDVVVTEPSLPETEHSAPVQQAANISASTIIEGLTVLLHRSLAISMDSQRAWNVLTHSDLHFLVQHFHWHQHQHGPTVFLLQYKLSIELVITFLCVFLGNVYIDP